MHGSKHKRKRIKRQCLECNSVFDDNYCKRHEQYCEKLQGHDQEDTAGTRGKDEEKNEEKVKHEVK